jgi:hypothetical protein
MRSHFGIALVVTALGALVACSSSSSSAVPAEAGNGGCTDTLANLINNASLLCPNDGNGNALPYDEAITETCAVGADGQMRTPQKNGDIEYGQCFQYLVFQVNLDTTGASYSKCFYDPGTHVLVGAIFADGNTDQCNNTSASISGGNVDPSCTITGLNGGGSGYQSCVPIVDAGSETSLLGQDH